MSGHLYNMHVVIFIPLFEGQIDILFNSKGEIRYLKKMII